MREALKNAHPLVQLSALVLIGFVSLFIFLGAVMIPFVFSGTGIGFLSNPGSVSDPNDSAVLVLKLMQIMQALGLFVIPYLVYRSIHKQDNPYALVSINGRLGMILVFSLTIVSALPMINFLAEWNSGLTLPESMSGLYDWIRGMEADAEALIRIFLSMDSVDDLIFNLILIAFIPAVAEEVFFRGTMQPLILKVVKNYHVAIWITAFLFSFFHMQFLGFVPRMILGAVFGYAAHWSGTLLLPMVGHLINNGLAVLITWYIGIDAIEESVETIGANEGDALFAVLSSTVLIAGLTAIYFTSQRLKRKAPETEVSEA
jgi:membrane protease YdiL (CAAX protease family)